MAAPTRILLGVIEEMLHQPDILTLSSPIMVQYTDQKDIEMKQRNGVGSCVAVGHLVLGKDSGVDGHAHGLHLGQHGHQRHLNLPQRLQQPLRLKLTQTAKISLVQPEPYQAVIGQRHNRQLSRTP